MEIKRNVAGSFELATSSVGVLGLEPRMTGPESVVLPLHHTPKSCFRTSFFRNAGAKVVFFFESPKVFAKKSQIILLISSIVCIFGFAELTSAYF